MRTSSSKEDRVRISSLGHQFLVAVRIFVHFTNLCSCSLVLCSSVSVCNDDSFTFLTSVICYILRRF